MIFSVTFYSATGDLYVRYGLVQTMCSPVLVLSITYIDHTTIHYYPTNSHEAIARAVPMLVQ